MRRKLVLLFLFVVFPLSGCVSDKCMATSFDQYGRLFNKEGEFCGYHKVGGYDWGAAVVGARWDVYNDMLDRQRIHERIFPDDPRPYYGY